jgi:hypothetical protein
LHNKDVVRKASFGDSKEALSMNDKERILDLVKKGVISSDEALILLENLAKEKDEKQLQKIAEKVETKKARKS